MTVLGKVQRAVMCQGTELWPGRTSRGLISALLETCCGPWACHLPFLNLSFSRCERKGLDEIPVTGQSGFVPSLSCVVWLRAVTNVEFALHVLL